MSFKVGDRVLFRKKGTLGHLRGALVLKEDNMDIEANPSTVIRIHANYTSIGVLVPVPGGNEVYWEVDPSDLIHAFEKNIKKVLDKI